MRALLIAAIILSSYEIILPQLGKKMETPPIVTIKPNGSREILFAPKQFDEINAFLKQNPDMELFTKENIDQYSKAEFAEYYKSGMMQFQYSCWGDFDSDKVLDVVVIFRSRKVVNNFNWHTFNFVLLKGQTNGSYSASTIYSFEGGCLDGLLYHKNDNAIEFFCSGVASGVLKWKNGKLTVKEMVGD